MHQPDVCVGGAPPDAGESFVSAPAGEVPAGTLALFSPLGRVLTDPSVHMASAAISAEGSAEVPDEVLVDFREKPSPEQIRELKTVLKREARRQQDFLDAQREKDPKDRIASPLGAHGGRLKPKGTVRPEHQSAARRKRQADRRAAAAETARSAA